MLTVESGNCSTKSKLEFSCYSASALGYSIQCVRRGLGADTHSKTSRHDQDYNLKIWA